MSAAVASGRTIGVDLGGTKCYGVVADADGTVLTQHRVPTPSGEAAIIDTLVAVVSELRRWESGSDPVTSIGVGVPGLVDNDGVLRFAPNLPGVFDLPVRTEIERRVPGVTARVENDATCAAWGERVYGAARGSDHAVLVTLGTGIGGGLISDGRLLRGANGFAGEIGHMVVDPNGPWCRCGARGCWERFASGTGLGNLAREAAAAGQAGRMIELAGGDAEAVRGEHVTAAAAEGDEQAKTVLQRFAWWLALGLANLANAFDPDTFVLGGGLVEAGDILLEPTREAFDRLVEASERRPPIAIVAAELGERAGAIGAANLAGAAS